METIDINYEGLDLTITFLYHPPVGPTAYEPMQDADVDLEAIAIDGVDIIWWLRDATLEEIKEETLLARYNRNLQC